MSRPTEAYEAVVMGASAGGIRALGLVLQALPKDFGLPVLIVQHMHPQSDSYLANILAHRCQLTIKQADEKEPILPNIAYLAPPGYHMLVEDDRTISLSLEGPVKFARPSVDVLFLSAVDVYRERLVGMILTGANSDGEDGVKAIKQAGGAVLVEDPKTAEAPAMPLAALRAATVDKVARVEDLGPYLLQLVNQSRRHSLASHGH